MSKINEQKDIKCRVQVTLDKFVLNSIDEFARLNGISRSGAISVVFTMYLKSYNATPNQIETENTNA